MKLYKYRGLTGEARKNTEILIRDRELYFAPPASFNDPYEFEFQLSFEGSIKEKMDFFKKTNPSIYDLLNSAYSEFRINYLSKLDTPLFKGAVNQYIQNVKERTGVLCLSDSPFNINMWSYYADNNSGICFEFEFDEEVFANSEFEVKYCSDLPSIKYFRQDVENLSSTAKEFTCSKYHSWEHEKEFRMVSNVTGGQRFSESSLKAVYLGLKFDLKDGVVDLLHSEFPDIDIYLLKKSDTKYALEVKNGMPVKFNSLWR